MRIASRSLLARTLAFAVSILGILASGCGGRTLERLPDGGSPSGTSTDPSNPQTSQDGSTGTQPGTGPGDPFPLCPEDPPEAGWTCITPHQGCAYVDVKMSTCVSWTCDSTGHWYESTPDGCSNLTGNIRK